MIHPSYYELMEKINENESDNLPDITSRYTIVLATSKRARQLINGAEPKVSISSPKQLSVAIEEFKEGLVRLVSDNEAEKTEEEVLESGIEEKISGEENLDILEGTPEEI